jgi:hypothetical protein
MTTIASRLAIAEATMRAQRPPEQSPSQAAFLNETLRIFEHLWATGEPPADAEPEALAIVLRLDARV